MMYNKFTVRKLRDMCRNLGIPVTFRMTKAELIKEIDEYIDRYSAKLDKYSLNIEDVNESARIKRIKELNK